MKVLHVYKNYAPTPGGIESYVQQLAAGLGSRGVSSTVLVTAADHRTATEQVGGVRVIRAGRIGELASTPLSVDLVRWVARSDADLIHLHIPYPVGELAFLLAGARRPLVVTYHSDVIRQWWARPFYTPLLHTVLQRAQQIIATSPVYLRTSPVLRAHADRCRVVPLSVDPARFRASPAQVAAVRDRWTSPRYPRLVLFVGRFRDYKGLPVLVRAITGLSARLLLVGAGPSEPFLRRLVGQLGLDDQVVILGHVDAASLPAYYQAADIFVLPSIQRSEAFGIVLLEAMASGRPVISTELGTGTSWVNQDGVNGLVVRPADVPALREALEALLADGALRERLGQAGRQRVWRDFSEGQMLDHVERIYREVGKQ